MFVHHPKIAKEFATKTASIKALPEKVGKKRPAMPNVSKVRAYASGRGA